VYVGTSFNLKTHVSATIVTGHSGNQIACRWDFVTEPGEAVILLAKGTKVRVEFVPSPLPLALETKSWKVAEILIEAGASKHFHPTLSSQPCSHTGSSCEATPSS
jgi:hypothetical protein